MASTKDLAAVKLSDFSPHLDEVFEMHTAGGVVPLKLAKAESGGPAGREGGAFSLFFVAPVGPWMPQSIYPLKHPAFGTVEIFLVPIGPMFGGNCYQAVFG
jgi:uncharacterized protein DUF6916